MRRIIWSAEAVDNLESVGAYVAEFNPPAAQRLIIALEAAANSLVDDPQRGRSVRRNLRELTIVHPYILRYGIAGDSVVILRIRHGARRS